MSSYKIIGQKPLKGTVEPVPNKNSILKLIPAALLTKQTVTIHNVPKSSDVRIMLKLVKQLGGKVSYLNEGNSVRINAENLNTFELDPELSQKAKASVMFMAPLLLRFKKAHMPIPGGCKLGSRPLDAFMENMEQLGAKYIRDKGYFLEADNLKANKVWSWFPSVTGTENLIMLATMTPGRTEIYNAACEPHTQDLCNMLVAMGAKISGIGTNRIVIEGVQELHGTEWTVISDHLDVGALIAAAAMTNGDVVINNAIPEHMGIILQVFEKLGVQVNIDGDSIHVPPNQKLDISVTARGDLLEIMALPWPLFPVDLIQIVIATALKAKGTVIIHSPMQEYGLFWIEELIKMKSQIVMADPHRAITFGPTEFQGTKIFAPNIIQATMALFLTALAGCGETILVDRDDALLRRYPDIVEKYTALGASVERIS